MILDAKAVSRVHATAGCHDQQPFAVYITNLHLHTEGSILYNIKRPGV